MYVFGQGLGGRRLNHRLLAGEGALRLVDVLAKRDLFVSDALGLMFNLMGASLATARWR